MENEKKQKPKAYVAQQEEEAISRMVLIWLNGCPEIPEEIGRLDFESIADAPPGMALSVIQGAYITERYILGGYQAEYQFKLIYRIRPGNSLDKRLRADEALNRIGIWASRNLPNLGALRPIAVDITGQAELFAIYEDGNEDHQILMKMTYEVT